MKRQWVCLLSLVAAACGSPSEEQVVDSSTSNQTVAEVEQAPEPVVLPSGYFVIEELTGPDGCNTQRTPQKGEFAFVGDGGTTLRFGGFALSASDDQGNFAGCDAEPVAEGRAFTDRYQSTTVTAVPVGDGIDVDVVLDDVEYRRAGDCPGFQMKLRPLADCSPAGIYTASARVVSGSCDLEWDSENVEITDESGQLEVQWGSGFTADLDSNACTASAERGVSSATSLDYWSYNGALREVSMTVSWDGLNATAVIDDALDGPTMFDESCPGARFEAQLERRTGLDESSPVQALECLVARPPVCGDGVCDDSESCSACESDCGCAAGETCSTDGPEPLCRATCDDVTVPGQCGQGARCGVLRDSAKSTRADEATYCVATAGRGDGEPCTSLSDCADGLLCHATPKDHGLGICSAPCGADWSCTDGQICEEAGTYGELPACVTTCQMFTSGACGPNAVCSDDGRGSTTCIARPDSPAGVGASCNGVACAAGLVCFFNECVMTCDTTADCADVGGTCSVEGTIGFCYGG